MRKPTSVLLFAAAIVASLAMAQGQPIRMDWVDDVPSSIEFAPLPDGSVLIKLGPVQEVSGDLTGALEERITQIIYEKAGSVRPWSTFFRLITAAGEIEGYYAGVGHLLKDDTLAIMQHGEVLSVTPAYAHLYQARVTYTALIQPDRVDGEGTLTIHPRERR